MKIFAHRIFDPYDAGPVRKTEDLQMQSPSKYINNTCKSFQVQIWVSLESK